MSESSPSYLSLLLKCSFNSFQLVHFPSNVGYDNQERTFLKPRNRITKTWLLISDASEERSWSTGGNVKIKKLSFKNEVEKPWRESSHTLPLTASCRPSRKKLTLHAAEEGRKIFSLPSNSPAHEKPPHPANEKLLSPCTPALLQRTSVWSRPSQLPPFLYKSMLLSFVLQTCLWFTTFCLSWITISLLFPNELILLVK